MYVCYIDVNQQEPERVRRGFQYRSFSTRYNWRLQPVESRRPRAASAEPQAGPSREPRPGPSYEPQAGPSASQPDMDDGETDSDSEIVTLYDIPSSKGYEDE